MAWRCSCSGILYRGTLDVCHVSRGHSMVLLLVVRLHQGKNLEPTPVACSFSPKLSRHPLNHHPLPGF